MSTAIAIIGTTIAAVGLFVAIVQLGLRGVDSRMSRLEQDWREERTERLRQQKDITDLKIEVEKLNRILESDHTQRCPPEN